MVQNWGMALARYRTALQVNPCNAFAWADMGEAFLGMQQPAGARRALQTATRLMANHYRAWSLLGQAEEEMGRLTDAAAAYKTALSIRPGYPLAQRGLNRTRGR
jgi:superkiller protein 3